MGYLAVDNDGDILPCVQKLHNLGALASEMSPTGLGVGILLDAAVGLAIKVEIDLDKALGWLFCAWERTARQS